MLAVVDRLYTTFGRYPLPGDLEVCEQCGPEWSVDDFRSTPLRSLSLLQLEAVHVMSLDDNGFRHFFPRLVELLLDDPAPVFAFDLARLKGRVPSWPGPERAAVRHLVDNLWQNLLARFPAALGYFSDSPTLIDFTYWCDEPLELYLRNWQSLDSAPARQQICDLIEYLSYLGEPSDPAVKPIVNAWLCQPAIGERLVHAGCEAALDLWAMLPGG